MLTGIVGVISIADLSGNSPQPAPVQLAKNVTVTDNQDDSSAVILETSSEPAPPKVSVSFNDETSSAYALLKGVSPIGKSSHRPDIDVWYGQYYSDEDYRVLPASPIEKEPSRLNVKISIGF